MIIQCPECKSRYRTRVMNDAHSALQIKCPKCAHQFLVGPEELSGQETESEKTTILMVDDARFFRELLVDILSERDANLVTADTAEDAWVKIHKQKVDLLIVDINLPDRNGLELIKDIRDDAGFAAMRILCISGVYRTEDDAKAALLAGADDFISKSFKPHELSERIDALLEL